MSKKRIFSGIAALAFVLAIVSMFRNQDTMFAAVFAILYGLLAISLFLPNAKMLKIIPLGGLVFFTLLCIIPWSYKIAYSWHLFSSEQSIPTWWDFNEIGWMYMGELSGERAIKNIFGWLGFGDTMQWLHLDCISAFLGVFALVLMLVSALMGGSTFNNPTMRIIMMILLIVSRFSAPLCLAYFFAFCSMVEGE